MNNFILYTKEYYAFCQLRKHLNPKTLKAYRIDLQQFADYCYNCNNFLSKNSVDNYITHLHRKYKAKTIKRKIASLKAFFHFLEYREYLFENPFHKIDISFREEKLLPKTIPFHTITLFFQTLYAAKENVKTEYQLHCCIRDIAVIELLFATGMRISELCSIKPCNIDFHTNTILIYGKGAKERILQIGNQEVLSSLLLYRDTFQSEISESGYFFVNRLKNKLSDQSVRKMILFYSQIAGITQHITPHMFRHSFATLLLEQDVDIRYIQQILGHSSISTTEIYTHVTNRKQKEILYQRHPRNLMNVNKG